MRRSVELHFLHQRPRRDDSKFNLSSWNATGPQLPDHSLHRPIRRIHVCQSAKETKGTGCIHVHRLQRHTAHHRYGCQQSSVTEANYQCGTDICVSSQVAMVGLRSACKTTWRGDFRSLVTHLRVAHSARDISKSKPWKFGASRTPFPSTVFSKFDNNHSFEINSLAVPYLISNSH